MCIYVYNVYNGLVINISYIIKVKYMPLKMCCTENVYFRNVFYNIYQKIMLDTSFKWYSFTKLFQKTSNKSICNFLFINKV